MAWVNSSTLGEAAACFHSSASNAFASALDDVLPRLSDPDLQVSSRSVTHSSDPDLHGLSQRRASLQHSSSASYVRLRWRCDTCASIDSAADRQHPFHLNPFRDAIVDAADVLLHEVSEDPARSILQELVQGICSTAVGPSLS
jgi:hypothetical protein